MSCRAAHDRRTFIATCAKLGAAAAATPAALDLIERVLGGEALAAGSRLPPVEAGHYTANADGSVTCGLCPRAETLKPDEVGYCCARKNVGGKLMTYGSGQPCVLNVDPIEKNPLCHVLPGVQVLSIAHAGCSLRCQYCQNWQFSQKGPYDTENIEFDRTKAFEQAAGKKLAAINFTYTEGTTHTEFNVKLAAEARKKGLRAFLCTNGYVQEKPLKEWLEVLDGVTVTIKGFTAEFYEKYLGGKAVQPVLDTCRRVKDAGKWIEVATLIVPGLNDGEKELGDIAAWICKDLGPHTPWHLERFVPQYKLVNRPKTPAETMDKALKIGKDSGLKYVYISNLAPHPANHTYCHCCKEPVIKRVGFKILSNSLKGGRCSQCRTAIPGIWT